MWSRTYRTNTTQTLPFLLGAGIILVFAGLLWGGILLARKFNVPAPALVEPSPSVSPRQITDNYLKELDDLDAALADPAVTRPAAEKKMNDFFFSARVPDSFRDMHLATVIKFKSDAKLTIANWRGLVINLRSLILKAQL